IQIDETAVAEESIDLDQPVSIKLEQVALRTCLDLVLQNARLAWVVKDGTLIVTTRTQARGKPFTQPHPVGDLLGSGEKGAAAGRRLIHFIASAVEPNGWDDRGGPGTMRYDPDTRTLQVFQVAELQEQIVDLLAALRRLREEQARNPMLPNGTVLDDFLGPGDRIPLAEAKGPARLTVADEGGAASE